MKMTFSIDKTRVEKRLNLMAASAKDIHEGLDAAGENLLVFFGETVFATQGTALGDPWRALAVSTLKARAARTGYYANNPVETGKILVWTGRLRSGFKKEVKPLQLRIFNTDEKFKYHQTTQRRMLGLTADVIARVVEEIQKSMAKNAGL